MDGSRFVTLKIRAPSMHGLQVSERELRHRGWPDGDLSAGYMQPFVRPRVYWLWPYAILLSIPSVRSYRINNYNPLLLVPFLLDSTVPILVANLALEQQSRSSIKFLAFVVPIYNSRIQAVVPALTGLSHQMTVEHAWP